MKNLNGGAAAGVLLGVGLLWGATPTVAAAGGAQAKTVSITGGGYSPSTLVVKGGQKVNLTFVSKGPGCANAVAIPTLKKSFVLHKGQKKMISFTPKKGQTVAFSCSMKMFNGKVVAR